MAQTASNKYFSNKQEAMISDYLGWKQVGGSGSRPFAPGDVNAYQWLGECKTHDSEQPNIVFFKKHWLKICEEAWAKNRYPVLFVDNGTQSAQNTWVMTTLGVFSPDNVNVIGGLHNTSTRGTSLTFDRATATELYKKNTMSGKFNVFALRWDRDLAVMPLSTFKDFIEESF